MPSRKVDEYQYLIAEGVQQKAYISCWNGGAFQGYIEFYEAGNVPAPAINSGGSFRLPYPIERLDAILTTLREESPVYIQIWGTSSHYCRVSTSREPVGEEEGLQS